MMLSRIKDLLSQKVDFAFETTGAITKCLKKQKKTDTHHLIFFWLETPELAEKRVQLRVENGGKIFQNQLF